MHTVAGIAISKRRHTSMNRCSSSTLHVSTGRLAWTRETVEHISSGKFQGSENALEKEEAACLFIATNFPFLLCLSATHRDACLYCVAFAELMWINSYVGFFCVVDLRPLKRAALYLPIELCWNMAGIWKSRGFNRVNVNEATRYFEPLAVALLIQGGLLSRHPHHRLPPGQKWKKKKWIHAPLQP